MKIIVILAISLLLFPLVSAQEILFGDGALSFSPFSNDSIDDDGQLYTFRQLFTKNRFVVPSGDLESHNFYVTTPNGTLTQLNEDEFECGLGKCTFIYQYMEEGLYAFSNNRTDTTIEGLKHVIVVEVEDFLGINTINENTDELEERTNDLEILINSFIDAVVEFIEGLPKGLSGHWGGFP